MATTVNGVVELERQAMGVPGIEGVVLRYGRLYGPGNWFKTATGAAPLHVDAAAQSALLAVMQGAPGLYSIAEDDGAVSSEKAKRDLGFDAGFRIGRLRD